MLSLRGRYISRIIEQATFCDWIFFFFFSWVYCSCDLFIEEPVSSHCWVVFPCMMHQTCLTIDALKDIGLFPVWGYYKRSCYEYVCTGFSVNIFFNFLGWIPRRGIAGSCDKCLFNWKRKCQIVFQWLSYFPCPPGVFERSSVSTFSSAFDIVLFKQF